MEHALLNIALPVVIASAIGFRERQRVIQTWKHRHLFAPVMYWGVAMLYLFCGALVTFPIVSAGAVGIDLTNSTKQTVPVLGLLSPVLVYVLARHLTTPTFEVNSILQDQRQFFHGCWLAFSVAGLVVGVLPGLLTSYRPTSAENLQIGTLLLGGYGIAFLIWCWSDREEIIRAWESRILFHPAIYWGIGLLNLVAGLMMTLPWFAPFHLGNTTRSEALATVQLISAAGVLGWVVMFLVSIWIAKPVFASNGISAGVRSTVHFIWFTFFFAGAVFGTLPLWL